MFDKLFGLGKLSKQAFANLIIKRGRASGEFENPRLDMIAFQITDGDSFLSLGNIYAEFLRMPRRERSGFIDRVLTIRTGSPTPETFAEAKGQLIPRIRDQAALSIATLQLQARATASDTSVSFEKTSASLVGSLVVTLVIDSPNSMTMLNDSLFEGWNVSFGTARAAAEANLLEHSTDPFKEIAPGLWLAPWRHDNYAASRILYPELLQAVTKDPLVCVPNRDTLLLADADNVSALGFLVDFIAAEAEGETYPISRELFQLQGMTLVPFEMPAGHPARGAYRRLHIGGQFGMYADQKQVLEETLDEDIFVASFTAFEHAEKGLFTCATWTKGVPTLLPRVEKLMILDIDDGAEEPSGMWEAPFEAFVDQELLLIQEQGLHPQRWRTLGFPGPELLARVATPLER